MTAWSSKLKTYPNSHPPFSPQKIKQKSYLSQEKKLNLLRNKPVSLTEYVRNSYKICMVGVYMPPQRPHPPPPTLVSHQVQTWYDFEIYTSDTPCEIMEVYGVIDWITWLVCKLKTRN